MSDYIERVLQNLQARVAQLESLPVGSVLGGGQGAAGRVALWNDANTLTSDADFTFSGDIAIVPALNAYPASGSGTVRRTVYKTGIADNVATAIFTVTTTDETGTADGGAYVCRVTAAVSHASPSATVAVKAFRASYSRAMINAGTGVNTAIEDNFTGVSAATTAATRDINTITMTVAETTEYVNTVSFQIDLTGTSITTAQVTALVEVIYTGFLTPPTIAVA